MVDVGHYPDRDTDDKHPEQKQRCLVCVVPELLVAAVLLSFAILLQVNTGSEFDRLGGGKVVAILCITGLENRARLGNWSLWPDHKDEWDGCLRMSL